MSSVVLASPKSKEALNGSLYGKTSAPFGFERILAGFLILPLRVLAGLPGFTRTREISSLESLPSLSGVGQARLILPMVSPPKLLGMPQNELPGHKGDRRGMKSEAAGREVSPASHLDEGVTE